jgi:hypothetical protein
MYSGVNFIRLVSRLALVCVHRESRDQRWRISWYTSSTGTRSTHRKLVHTHVRQVQFDMYHMVSCVVAAEQESPFLTPSHFDHYAKSRQYHCNSFTGIARLSATPASTKPCVFQSGRLKNNSPPRQSNLLTRIAFIIIVHPYGRARRTSFACEYNLSRSLSFSPALT